MKERGRKERKESKEEREKVGGGERFLNLLPRTGMGQLKPGS